MNDNDGLTWTKHGPPPDPASAKRNEELREKELREQQECYDAANEGREQRRSETD